MAERIYVGTAGWGIPASVRDRMPADGTTLQRYAQRLNCVEINSTFVRTHRASTFERWAASTPPGFAFSLKIPKTITHDRKLANCFELLDDFLASTALLGDKRRVLLVQLPPKLAYDEAQARRFFEYLRDRYRGGIALEPRHPQWFGAQVDRWLLDLDIARVAADPSPVPQARVPGGARTLTYFRLHGSPRTYYSAYDRPALAAIASALCAAPKQAWCIFDNTASGAALGNALETIDLVGENGYDARMEPNDEAACPGCGHALDAHHGRHCDACEAGGNECPAADPGSLSEGG